jgi:uncharacterized protein
MKRNEISIVDVLVVTLIFAGPFVWCSSDSVGNNFATPQFNDSRLMGLVMTELILGAIALGYLALRVGSLRLFSFEISFRETSYGFVLFFVATLIAWGFDAIIGRHLPGAEVMDSAARHASMGLIAIAVASIVNGIYEEFFLVRFMVEAFAKHGVMFAIGASSLVRIAYHFYQGPQSAVSTLIFGIVVTAFYWRFRRIWPVMVSHILADVVGLAGL